MDTYSYEATTKEGSIITGTLEAENERRAVDRIQDLGYFPLKISKAEERGGFGISALPLPIFRNKIKESDIMTFTYQIGVLIDAGFPLERALSILSELSDKKALKDLLKDILSHVRGGKSFSEALSKFPAEFPAFYVNMIKAGEAGGFLEDTISRMVVYLENSQRLKEDIRSALIYPAILCIVGGTAVIVLLTFVVPRFSQIFSDAGTALPLPTVILLSISSMLRRYWWIIGILLYGLFFLLRRHMKSEAGRRLWDEAKFRLPLFGKLFREGVVSRFARTLGTLLANGVPILNALQIVKGTMGSEKMAEVVSSVREGVRKGKGIAEPLKASNVFPPLAIHMVIVGEETGKLDEMLLKIADRFDLQVRTTVKRMLSLLEPALILLMGAVVGFIVIAMLMAIFSINELPF
ncbi:MAG: type II secretion system F family protein [Nitrospirae bacterium]|nr:type II secretion system F family protein [Nitrospirota bacterium]MBI4839104.1 type II secretion system F family protein [Nitrospirota bacterium]